MPKAVVIQGDLTPEIMAHCRNAQRALEAPQANAGLTGHIVGVTGLLRLDCSDRQCSLGSQHSLCEGSKTWRSGRGSGASGSEHTNLEPPEFEDHGHWVAEGVPGRLSMATENCAFLATENCTPIGGGPLRV